MSDILNVYVFGEKIGSFMCGRTMSNDEIIEKVGGHWLDEHGVWTLRPETPLAQEWWFTGEDVVTEWEGDDKAVYLVNIDTLEIEESTRAEVLSDFGFSSGTDWNDEGLLQALDNANLIDFESLEDAEQYVEENK